MHKHYQTWCMLSILYQFSNFLELKKEKGDTDTKNVQKNQTFSFKNETIFFLLRNTFG